MKLLSLFSGIGAFEKALDRLNVKYELVNYCEIDKYAAKSYALIHGCSEDKNLGDITKVDTSKLPKDIDLLTYGFPCQDISLAGNQKGFENEDGSRTRSGLFFEALRIIEDVKPKVAIAENVKNLVSKKFKKEFEIVLSSLEEAGYNNYWQILNAKDYGIPQNRERVFIVSIRKDIDKNGYKFPDKFPLDLRLKDLLEDEVDEKYYLSDKMVEYIKFTGTKNYKNPDCKINLDVARPLTTGQGKRAGTTNYVSDVLPDNFDLRVIRKYGIFDKDGKTHQAGSVYDVEGLAPTLDTMQGGYRQPCIEDKKEVVTCPLKNQATEVSKITDVANTLLARDYKGFGNQEMNAVIEVSPKVLIKNKTKQGYLEAEEGDGIDISSRMQHYRGTVQKGISQTLDTQCNVGIIVPLKRGYSVEIRDEQEDTTDIDVIGNYSKSNYNATVVVVGKNGVAPTVRENHGQVTGVRTKNKRILKMLEDNDLFEKDPSHLDVYNQKINYNECGTLKAGMDHQQGNIIYSMFRIRKLTPKECWRLMDFDDEDIEIVEENGISNTQLYKQAGNSIVVAVLEKILGNLKEIFEVKKVEEKKIVTYHTDKMINLELLMEKEPHLFEELAADYPCEDATYVYEVKKGA